MEQNIQNRNKFVFYNQKGIEISNKELRDEILKNIKQIGNYSIPSKYYTFLNKRNLYEIKDGDFLVSLSSYGKKFIIYLMKMNNKKYSILINKKNEVMIHCQYMFHQSLYDGTLFDGELVKNEDNKWIFIINDIPYYKGENIITKSFEERQEILDNILENEYMKSEGDNIIHGTHVLGMTYITKKIYFPYENMEDMCKRFRESLKYKSSGIYFKNIYNYSDNYLYLFPECRTDHQVLQRDNVETTLTTTTSTTNKTIKNNDVEDDIFGDVEVETTTTSTTNKKMVDKDVLVKQKTCDFLIKPTIKPEVYELYCRSVDRHIERYSYAGIPNMETSLFVKNLVKDVEYDMDLTTYMNSNKRVYVKCKFNKITKKWIPIERAEQMDHHNNINKIQVILDNADSDSESDDE